MTRFAAPKECDGRSDFWGRSCFAADPFVEGPRAARVLTHGAVLVDGGRIAAVGEADSADAAHPQATRPTTAAR
jgi:imidazolonepropionase-like amidohydrolase